MTSGAGTSVAAPGAVAPRNGGQLMWGRVRTRRRLESRTMGARSVGSRAVKSLVPPVPSFGAGSRVRSAELDDVLNWHRPLDRVADRAVIEAPLDDLAEQRLVLISVVG
jgi:hypothetical protein